MRALRLQALNLYQLLPAWGCTVSKHKYHLLYDGGDSGCALVLYDGGMHLAVVNTLIDDLDRA